MTDHSDKWWEYLSENDFQRNFHFSKETFIALQAEIDNLDNVDNKNTDVNLLATVWFLTNTEPIYKVSELFGLKNASKMLEEQVLRIIKLAKFYLIFPDEKEADIIEKLFKQKYKIPGTIGVLGSLHINIDVSDCHRKSIYYNTMTDKYTFVLQIVADCNLLLRDVCTGCPGGDTVENILRKSPLYKRLMDKNGFLVKKQMHLFGGTEHPQMNTLLTPYKCDNLSEKQHKFNELHSKVMELVEKTFISLENRFPRIRNVDNFAPYFASIVVSAICILHNFTRIMDDNCELYVCKILHED